MNQRIKNLRDQSLQAIPTVSAERALLVTEFYKMPEVGKMSAPVRRAKAFEFILQKKQICINPGELIVGERGPAIKATPTYPEVCLHSLHDLDVLNTRPKVWFRVSDETRQQFENEIIPFWTGKTNRENIMDIMSLEWHNSYKAGVFTEFLEQRAPGHTVAGHKIYQMGLSDLVKLIGSRLSRPGFEREEKAKEKLEQLEAMKIAAEAMIQYATRHAEVLEEQMNSETDINRVLELKEMAGICRKVPMCAPSTFHEALQHYWFFHVGVITELNPWDSFNPGRLDQHLYPFYKNDLERGILTKERVKELLQCFWIKFNNHPAPPKVGVTALESNTYTDFALINLGGLTPEGADGVNELTFLVLDVIEEMRLLQPSSMVQVSKKNPDKFVQRALEIIKTGFGQPSVFNTDAILMKLLNQGKNIIDARRGGASGCVETGAFGTESYILTGYFNLPKILELTLNNGIDPRSGEQLGPKTGEAASFASMEDLLLAYKKQLIYFIDIKLKGNHQIEQIWSQNLPAPFLSLIIDDCIENALDYNSGGARYNTKYIQGVGLGSLTDSLTALRYHVFENKTFSMSELIRSMKMDFEGSSIIRDILIHKTPKYGNDDDYADQQAKLIFEMYFDAVNGKNSWRGATYRINLLPTTCHVYFGSVIHALPDGRKAGQPLSEGISPVQGADRNGPTAVLKSASKIDHLRTGGTLLNQKFSPSFFDNDEALKKLTALIRTYFKFDGHHIQFNVVTAKTLMEAQRHPEKHRDLIVRVAGYSDYFNDLGTDLQNEIITRTMHGEG